MQAITSSLSAPNLAACCELISAFNTKATTARGDSIGVTNGKPAAFLIGDIGKQRSVFPIRALRQRETHGIGMRIHDEQHGGILRTLADTGGLGASVHEHPETLQIRFVPIFISPPWASIQVTSFPPSSSL